MEMEFESRMIRSLDELMSEILAGRENIIYGAGGMAHRLLRYLWHRGLSYYILCVTVENDSINPTELYGIPVIAIRYIPHFYRTASFFAAVSEKLHGDVEETLRAKNVKKIITISDSVFAELEKEFRRMPTNDMIDRGNEMIRLQIERMNRVVSWQPEVVRTNTEAFQNFKDVNAGREIVLMATGPTTSQYVRKKDALHIGVNTAPILNIPLDYYFAHDNRAFTRISLENAVDRCEGEIIIGKFAGRLAYLQTEIDTTKIEKDKRIHQYIVSCPSMTEDLVKNICQHPLTDYYSIVFPALQFALYTHPSRIYLVGCDVSGKLEHFNEASDIVEPHARYVKLGHGLLKRFVEIYYPDVEICSINPVGLKGLFKDYIMEHGDFYEEKS